MPAMLEKLEGGADRVRATCVLLAGGVAAFGLGLLIAGWGRQAVLPVVGIVVVATVLRWPVVGFLGVIASLPMDVSGTFGETALTKLSITKTMAALTLAAAGLDILLHRRRVPIRCFVTPEAALTAMLLLVIIASAALHPTSESTAEVVRQTVILLFVLVIIYFVDTPERLRQIVTALIVVGTAIAMYSIVQRVLRPVGISEEWVAQAGAVLDVGEENLGEMLRTTGTFSHPAWLGLFLTLCMPFTLGLSWSSGRLSWRAAGVLAVVLQILGVLSTYSRMSYIGAALAVGLFLLRRRLGIAVLSLAAIGMIALFPTLPEDFQNRVYSIVEYRQSSSSLSRLGQQLAGFYMFLDHPALGAGPGNFESMVTRYGNRIPVTLEVQSIGAHNMYVQAAAELGLAGLTLLLLLLLLTGRQLRRLRLLATRYGEHQQSLIWEAAGIALWVFIVSGLFVHAQYRKEWWLLVGLAAAGRRLWPNAARPRPREMA